MYKVPWSEEKKYEMKENFKTSKNGSNNFPVRLQKQQDRRAYVRAGILDRFTLVSTL